LSGHISRPDEEMTEEELGRLAASVMKRIGRRRAAAGLEIEEVEVSFPSHDNFLLRRLSDGALLLDVSPPIHKLLSLNDSRTLAIAQSSGDGASHAVMILAFLSSPYTSTCANLLRMHFLA
jgi:hypothetical protein